MNPQVCGHFPGRRFPHLRGMRPSAIRSRENGPERIQFGQTKPVVSGLLYVDRCILRGPCDKWPERSIPMKKPNHKRSSVSLGRTGSGAAVVVQCSLWEPGVGVVCCRAHTSPSFVCGDEMHLTLVTPPRPVQARTNRQPVPTSPLVVGWFLRGPANALVFHRNCRLLSKKTYTCKGVRTI